MNASPYCKNDQQVFGVHDVILVNSSNHDPIPANTVQLALTPLIWSYILLLLRLCKGRNGHIFSLGLGTLIGSLLINQAAASKLT